MTQDWIQLHPDAIEIAPILEFVTDGQAGGIAIFLGTTRAERNASGQDLIALDYEAYEAMARSQLENLATHVRQKWPVRRLVLLHRIGRVPVGAPSVIIAVSTPHRADAFEACRWLIDTLKSEVAIWKQEVWSDGGKTWVHP